MPRKGPMTVPAPKQAKMVHGTWPPTPQPVAEQTAKAFNSIKPQAASTREYGKKQAGTTTTPDFY